MNMWSAILFGLAVFNFGFCIYGASNDKYPVVMLSAFTSGFCVFSALYRTIPK
jgi:hypothetical protein